MNRPSFYWWDDAVEAARLIAQQTGIRQRVYRAPLSVTGAVRVLMGAAPPRWCVAPAFLRSVG